MSPGRLKLRIIFFTTLILLGGFFVFQKNVQAAAGINKKINFQGKVVNTDGTNVVDANYNFIFRIYNQQAPGGAVIWTEAKSLAVIDGIFQTSLGDTTILPGSVDFDTDNIFLGVEFNANGEMTPRVQFTAAPYAFNADLLDGKDWSVPGAIGSTTPNSGIFTNLGVRSTGTGAYNMTIKNIENLTAGRDLTVTLGDANRLLDLTGGNLTLGGSLTTVGASALTLTTTGPTNITLPTSGTLLANPMTTLGDIIYGAAAGAPTRLGASAGFLTSNGSAAPSWTAASADYFTQYALLAGRAGGQTVTGGTVANDILTLKSNSAVAGNVGTSTAIQFNVGNSGATAALSILQNGTLDFHNNPTVGIRIENADASVLAPSCDGTTLGRMYYDTSAGSAFVCIESAPGVYGWFDYTTTSVQSNKVVTVGTGGDFTSISAGAGYLNALGGGIILLTPETHNVTSVVDVENISLIGANTGDTRINIAGGGRLRVKETQFKSMTIYVDATITASSGIDAKYSVATTSSIIFEWVDFITNGTKVLLNSSDASKPTVRTRFISVSATAGTQKILLPKATANINTASTHFVESQGGSGALDLEDWDVKIAGSSNVKTSGTITTIPDSTIYVYPGMSIQGAINSISSGGVITLLPGVHNISSTLLVNKDNIQIQGYGDASIVRASGLTGGDTIAAIQVGAVNGATPNNNVILNDFRLEVSGVGASDIHGVRVAGGSDNQLLSLSIVKTSGASGTGAGARMGVLMMDGTTQKLTRPVIKGCTVMGTSAVTAYFTDGIHVTGGASYGAGSGIFTNGQGVDAALVDSNQVDYVRETVAVFVGVNNSSLFNNRFSRMGAGGGGAFGVFFGNSSNVNMTANVVATSLSTASYGLVIDTINSGSLKQVTDSVFTANAIDGSANGGTGFAYGVNIGAAANTAFHRNIFTNNTINGASNATTYAINITGNADDNNFSNNIINGINNTWDTGITIVSATAERNFIGKNAFITTTVKIADAGTATQMDASQHNATVNPGAGDDNVAGYVVGTVWVNTTTQNAFIATNVTTGAAVWKAIDGSGSGTTYSAGSGLGLAGTVFSLGNLTANWAQTGAFDIISGNGTFNNASASADLYITGNIEADGAFYGSGAGLTSITNSALVNSAVTVSAGSGLSGGGAVSLGGTTTLTLNLASANTWTAAQSFAALTATSINGLTLASAADGFTIAGGTTPRTLTITGGNVTLSGNNTGDVTLAGQNYLSIIGQAITANAIDLSGTNVTGALAAARFPALTGDITTTAGSLATALANSGVAIGTYRSVTVDAKGRVTNGTNPTTMAGYGLTDVIQLQGSTPGTQQAGNLNISGTGIFGGVSIAAGQSYTGAGAVSLSSGAATGLTINSGTTGAINIGDDGSAETINIGTGAADKSLVIGSTNSTSTTTIQSGSGDISLQANGTGTGNVQIGDGGVASATPDMLVLDDGSAEPTGIDGAMYYSTALSKFRCYEGGAWKNCITSDPKTAAFADTTPAAIADNNTTELFNDVTKPNITPVSTTQAVLVTVHMRFTGGGNVDTDAAVQIYRNIGANPTCGTSTLVGDSFSAFLTNNTDIGDATATFLDSPGTTSNVRYTVCSSANSVLGSAPTSNRIDVAIVALGADLAENYYTQDDSIEPGDIVTINTALSAGVQKSSRAYDAQAIGVVSTVPGLVLQDELGIGSEGRAVPVALSGRIPVKVSIENGRVKAGDYLTSSSVPGVAMKATKSGIVIGQALQDFSYQDDKIGLVLTFVKNTYFNGTQIMDSENKPLTGAMLLQKLLDNKAQSSEASSVSDVVTDRIVAGLEVVTPQVTADTIIAKTIRAEHIEGLEIMEVGIQTAQNAADNNANDVKSLGQRIASIQNIIKSLSVKSETLIMNSLVEFRSQVVFKSITEFMDRVVFHKEVEFAGQVMFNQDVAGYAAIKDGQDRVRITFEKEYAVAPVVNASISLQQIEDDEVRKASEDLLLLNGARFIITNVTTKGFEIRIDQETISEIPFSWQAIAVKDAKTFSKDSDKTKDGQIVGSDIEKVANMDMIESVQAAIMDAPVAIETVNLVTP